MPASRKPRKRYRQRPVDYDPISLAITAAATLSTTQQLALLTAAEEAFGRFRAGRGSWPLWRELADAMNLAEALSEAAIGSNHKGTFLEAQHALADLAARQQLTGSWTLHSRELAAIDTALAIYAVQVSACSTREWREAMERVKNTARGALAGQAGRGCVVVGGALKRAEGGAGMDAEAAPC